MLPDDHPWPELGSVSRGATRGNQGSKGSLSSSQSDGRCVLQLRVQPGVLAVTLTRQASEWYRTLDDAVTSALKLTKGYWRKARRRQDYDSQADQDHIELNEWLQQLKDKVMAHLEMLIAKGEIRGPPYIMSDDQEFTFLRKFIERQRSNVPHNPRLRGLSQEVRTLSSTTVDLPRSETPDEPKASTSYTDDSHRLLESEERNVASSSSAMATQPIMRPSLPRIGPLMKDVQNNKQEVENARRTLIQARKDTQVTFQKYINLLEAERRAQNALEVAEERRGELLASFVDYYQAHSFTYPNTGSPNPADNRLATSPFQPPRMAQNSHHSISSPFPTTVRHPVASPLSGWDAERHDRPTPAFSSGAGMTVNQFPHADNSAHWSQNDARVNLDSSVAHAHADAAAMRQAQNSMPMGEFIPQMAINRNRKHGRDWAYGDLEDHSADPEGLSGMPSRKRTHPVADGLRVQASSDGLHMVAQQDEALSASHSHLSAAHSQFRDAPT